MKIKFCFDGIEKNIFEFKKKKMEMENLFKNFSRSGNIFDLDFNQSSQTYHLNQKLKLNCYYTNLLKKTLFPF
jgi:hypothetical protein